MLKITAHILFILIISILFVSCASIFGGSSYQAHVKVRNHPQAQILHNGELKGYGMASFSVKRKDANKFFTSIVEEGCPVQKFQFTSRTMRGIPFAIDALLFGLIPIGPVPIIIDLILGSIWKPNIDHPSINQINTKTFLYILDYTTCEDVKKIDDSNKELDVVYLKNGSIIYGSIIETIPNKHIKFKSSEGSELTIKMEHIQKLEQGGKAQE